jgi:hypothetical protein
MKRAPPIATDAGVLLTIEKCRKQALNRYVLMLGQTFSSCLTVMCNVLSTAETRVYLVDKMFCLDFSLSINDNDNVRQHVCTYY